MKSAIGIWRMLGVLAGLTGGAARLQGQSLTLSHPVMVFLSRVGAGDPGPQHLSIRSTPTAASQWTIPTTPPAWLAVAPAAGTGPGDVVLTAHSAGLAAGFYHVQLTVSCGPDSKTVEVILVVTDPNGNIPQLPINIPLPPSPPGPQVRYLVEFNFVGYSGLIDAYPDCAVNPSGIDHMIGILASHETAQAADDESYTGLMARNTIVDYCDVRPKAGLPDEVVYCVESLTGRSVMQVELTVTGDPGRGAYMKAEQGPGPETHQVTGDCTTATARDIRTSYPGADGGGGGAPDGQPIQDQPGPLQLAPGGLPRLKIGYYPVHHPETTWSMRVLARITP